MATAFGISSINFMAIMLLATRDHAVLQEKCVEQGSELGSSMLQVPVASTIFTPPDNSNLQLEEDNPDLEFEESKALTQIEHLPADRIERISYGLRDAEPALPALPSPKPLVGGGEMPALFWGYRYIYAEKSRLTQVVDTDSLNIIPPSDAPYAVNRKRSCFGQWGQDKLLYPILHRIKDGFFVESGAYDGESGSNTLLYELEGWKGLLVEPEPNNFKTLLQKHRRAYAFQGALSPSNQIEKLKFGGSDQGGHFDEKGSFDVTAAPLAELLKACNTSTVDFWSLDIEGSEGIVLEAMDFNQIEVGVLLIEMNKGSENNDRVNSIMNKAGFVDIGFTLYNEGSWAALDHIFVNPKYFQARGLPTPEKFKADKSQATCQGFDQGFDVLDSVKRLVTR